MTTETKIKEHPILFSGPMVRAILDGRKTQTRRAIKPQPGVSVKLHYDPHKDHWYADGLVVDCKDGPWHCPYGVPGDRLWVRETFNYEHDYCNAYTCGNPDHIFWKANEAHPEIFPSWKPSIHMPRWASRIDLLVKNIRVERVQDISAKDIIAEGAVLRPHVDQFGRNPVSAFDGKVYMDLRSLWAAGWNSINAKRGFGWDINPWVWVVEFEKVQA